MTEKSKSIQILASLNLFLSIAVLGVNLFGDVRLSGGVGRLLEVALCAVLFVGSIGVLKGEHWGRVLTRVWANLTTGYIGVVIVVGWFGLFRTYKNLSSFASQKDAILSINSVGSVTANREAAEGLLPQLVINGIVLTVVGFVLCIYPRIVDAVFSKVIDSSSSRDINALEEETT